MLSSRVIFSFILFLISFSSSAQLGFVKYIDEVDVIGGIGVVSMRGGEWPKHERVAKIGYSFGLGFRHKLPTRFSFSAQVLFERKGLNKEFDYYKMDANGHPVKTGRARFLMNLSYVSIPILLRYSFHANGKFYIQGGGFASYLIKQQEVFDDLTKNQRYINPSSAFESFDAGVTFGIGHVIFSRAKSKFDVQITGSLGLVDVNASSDPYATVYSNSLVFSLVFSPFTK